MISVRGIHCIVHQEEADEVFFINASATYMFIDNVNVQVNAIYLCVEWNAHINPYLVSTGLRFYLRR